MPRYVNLTGQRFGRLHVMERAPNCGACVAFRCRCDCGAESIVRGNSLRVGATRSCGCLHREAAAMIGAGNATHGQSGTALHEIWLNMRKRCQCESDPAYARYGGRGIKVCRRWNDFQLFAADVGERPSPSHTIDRRDNDGDYEPGNCRWATYEEQNNNRRDNRWITFRGETRTVGAWANVIGMNQGTLHGRLRSEWPIEQALTSPVRERRHG